MLDPESTTAAVGGHRTNPNLVEFAMTVQVLVLGDGTGGLVTANLLAKESRRQGLALRISVIGHSPQHTYQPGMLFMPFQKPGYRTIADIQRPTADFIGEGVEYRCERIAGIDPALRRVTTDHGEHAYDWLVLALGSPRAPPSKNSMNIATPNAA